MVQDWVLPARRNISVIGPKQFRILNKEINVEEKGWDDLKVEKLWRYNLHYFDDLNALNASSRAKWNMDLISDWILKNPAPVGSGWEPYPLSLRIVNWIKASSAEFVLSEQALQSLAVQCRMLTKRLEWHLAGNHLFVNGKALIFAGAFFEGDEPGTWLKLGFGILEKEISEQILPDGAQFELSPMYHALAVEDCLDILNVTKHFGLSARPEYAAVISELTKRVPEMLRWLQAMCHPDGEISFFNDAAIGVAPSPRQLFDYAGRLGFCQPPLSGPVTYLQNSGYVRLEKGIALLIADVARVGPDYLPAHAHADTLSFELSLGDQRIVVNSGTSVYGVGPERHRQRSTQAHSALVINGRNSSDVWSGFRVGKRALPSVDEICADGPVLSLAGSHDGYTDIAGQPLHKRRWVLDDRSLCVTDQVVGNGVHSIDIHYYFAPQILVERISTTQIRLADQGTLREIATIDVQNGMRVTIKKSSWHPEFGLSLPNYVMHLEFDGQLPFDHQTTFNWNKN